MGILGIDGRKIERVNCAPLIHDIKSKSFRVNEKKSMKRTNNVFIEWKKKKTPICVWFPLFCPMQRLVSQILYFFCSKFILNKLRILKLKEIEKAKSGHASNAWIHSMALHLLTLNWTEKSKSMYTHIIHSLFVRVQIRCCSSEQVIWPANVCVRMRIEYKSRFRNENQKRK